MFRVISCIFRAHRASLTTTLLPKSISCGHMDPLGKVQAAVKHDSRTVGHASTRSQLKEPLCEGCFHV